MVKEVIKKRHGVTNAELKSDYFKHEIKRLMSKSQQDINSLHKAVMDG